MTLAVQAMSRAGSAPSALGAWTASLLAAVTSAALLVGFLTPVACVVAALGATVSWFLPSLPPPCETRLATVLAGAIAAAVALLGPGAFSLDAHLFGRREVVILPAPERAPED